MLQTFLDIFLTCFHSFNVCNPKPNISNLKKEQIRIEIKRFFLKLKWNCIFKISKYLCENLSLNAPRKKNNNSEFDKWLLDFSVAAQQTKYEKCHGANSEIYACICICIEIDQMEKNRDKCHERFVCQRSERSNHAHNSRISKNTLCCWHYIK